MAAVLVTSLMQSQLSKQRQQSGSASVKGCIINIAPVLFEDKRVEVTVLDYEDDEKFNALRNELRGAYFVRRDRGTRIVCVSLDPDASGISGKTETIQLGENLRLCAGLVREALIEYANRVGRPSTKHDPVMIFGGKNLLTECMPPGITVPSWLQILTRYHASPFVLKSTREHFTLALALDVRTSRQITASCSELTALGFPLEGLYVGTYKSGHDPRLSPIFSLAGRILSVSGNDLLLEDYGGGSDSVKADVMFLEPSLTAFEHCLSHLFGDKSVAIKAALDKRLSESRNGPGRLDKLEKCRQNISGLNLELIPGVPFTLDPFLAEGEKTFPRMADAPKTIYVLDPTGNHTDTWHDRGLSSYGPYTANSFTPNTPNICVICQRNYRGRVEQFIHKLWNGIQVSGSTKPVFAKGMVRKYALDGVNIEFFDTQDDTADAYRKTILQAISSQEERGQKWHLALIQTQERFHDLHGDDNPYLSSPRWFQ